MRNRFSYWLLIIAIFTSLLLPFGTALAQEHNPQPAGTVVQAESGETPGNQTHESNLGEVLPLWSVIPFIGILLSIAIFPLIAPHFWHHHFGKVSAFWALLFAIPFVLAYHGHAVHEILHIYLADYIPFIILLWGLFTASGGILLKGSLAGTPAVNVIFLIIGTILASWMGTTGAAMLLIRPVIRANAKRKNKVHVIVFFIFLVANIGGSLTPLGDPPLFLGFLHGVPFFWTLSLFPEMLLVSSILIILFFIVDSILFKRENQDINKIEDKTPLRLEGAHNFLFLAGIMMAVLISGTWKPGEISIFGIQRGIQDILREILIITMGLLSLWTTKKSLRKDNEFTWFPIKEVAYLFAGIFMAIIPALLMLRAGTQGALSFIINAVKEPWNYFWITGALSSFLDNAPTYLTFFNTALGRLSITEPEVTKILTSVAQHPAHAEFITYLKAISVGAVFFGANTYIGNAPNFMVKSIAEEQNIKMPSFFGYMLYSTFILIPCFLLVTLVFF